MSNSKIYKPVTSKDVKDLTTRLERIEAKQSFQYGDQVYAYQQLRKDLYTIAFACGAILAIVILIYRFMPREATANG